MQLIFVVFLSLLLSMCSVSVWQSIERLVDDVGYYAHVQNDSLLLDGLIAYACAMLASDRSLVAQVRLAPLKLECSPWKSFFGKGAPMGTLVYSMQGQERLCLTASLLRGGVVVGSREVLLELKHSQGLMICSR